MGSAPTVKECSKNGSLAAGGQGVWKEAKMGDS